MIIQKGKKPDILDSKFGSLPCWDLDKEYPTDENGDKLMPVRNKQQITSKWYDLIIGIVFNFINLK